MVSVAIHMQSTSCNRSNVDLFSLLTQLFKQSFLIDMFVYIVTQWPLKVFFRALILGGRPKMLSQKYPPTAV
jgi:hypothetical protein